MFKNGQGVIEFLTGAGFITQKEFTVQKVSDGEVWLDNGRGSDPTGPFDAETGEYLGYCVFGFSKRIEAFRGE